MRTVRVACPTCGPQTLTNRQVWLILAGTFQAYRYRCPGCRMIDVREAGDAMFLRLAVHGCPVWAGRPLELDETHTGPPITYDELLDFIIDLRRTAPLRELFQ